MKLDTLIIFARVIGFCGAGGQSVCAAMWFAVWRQTYDILDRDTCRLLTLTPSFIFPYVLVGALILSLVALAFAAWIFLRRRGRNPHRLDVLLLGLNLLGALACLAAFILYADGYCR
jgi:hypothetical protein